MRDLNNSESQVRRVHFKQLQGLWQQAMVALAVFLLMGTAASAQDPGKGGTVANFEVDSDFQSGFIPAWWNTSNYSNRASFGDDWSKGLTGTGNAVLKQEGGVSIPGTTADLRSLWQVDGNWGNQSAVAEVASFSGNSNKNGDNIAPGQKPYTIQLGGSGPQKNDITNTYLHSRDVSGATWLFFGAETRSTNGNSYLDFEYNQNGVEIVGSQLVGKANDPANNIINGRTVNDFLLVVNYTGGGNRPVVGVRKWLASGTWSAELPVSSLGAYVTTNTGSIDPVAPNRAFTGEGAYANTVMALQFVEGGINISAIPDLADLDRCNPLATVTVKTRSSSSYTAELKDLDILNFQLVPGATISDLSPVTACPGGSAVFSTTVSGDGASAGNVVWYKGTSTTPLADDNTKYDIVVSGSTSTLTINSLVAGDAGAYRAKLTNATCGNPEKSQTLTVNPAPTANAGADPAAQCLIAAGNTFSLSGSGSNGTALWTVKTNASNLTVAITNETSYTPTVTVSGGSGTVTLLLTVTSGFTPSCGTAEDEVNVTVNPNPTISDPAIGAICAGTTSASLTYSGVGNGADQYKIVWSSAGLTSMTEFASLPASPITINGTGSLAAATYSGTIYVRNSATLCESAGAPLSLLVNPNPSVNAGTDPAAQCFIDGGNTFMPGGSGSNGTPVWSVFSNPNSLTVDITNGTTFTPTVKVTGVGTVTLRLTVSSNTTPSCGSVYDDVNVTVSPKPGPPAVKYNAPACDEVTFSVEVLSPEIGTTYIIVNSSDGGNRAEITAVEDATSPGSAAPVVFTGRAAGSGYRVTAQLGDCVTEAEVCGDAAPTLIETQSSTQSLQGASQESKQLTAYPVPFYNDATVEFASERDGNYVINLYDMKGSLIRELKSGTARQGEVNKIEVDGRSLPEGMYFVRFVNGAGAKTVKLLKKQ
ncbi:T9SS type A sorting domain-containing protein [Pontibacter toksunensis]|uniref:T9SS type A sorting domain-containing protein n=1 Tax=Pontibacter toksunensis TaxID=1332631 RepID=A0ABW6C0T1_9BACT